MIDFLARKVIATAAQFVDDNAATFIEGGEALHKLFRNFANARPDYAKNKFSRFSDI